MFEYTITTHQFNPSNYFNTLSKDRLKLHNEINKLHLKGWGYTKIHTHLIKNGFKIGKSRTCVDSIIKKRLKREEFLNQPIKEEYRNFDIEFVY